MVKRIMNYNKILKNVFYELSQNYHYLLRLYFQLDLQCKGDDNKENHHVFLRLLMMELILKIILKMKIEKFSYFSLKKL